MKKVILLIVFLPYLSFGQVTFNFEEGLISGWTETVPGRWAADASGSISGNYSLHHVYDNPSSGSDCIGVPLTNLHPSEGTTRWRFMIKHGYDPSASNSWSLFLMSDHDPASFDNGLEVNGFAAGVNLSGYDDTLRLWKVKNGSPSIVAACPVNWQNDVGTSEAALIDVERSETGSWKITSYDSQNNTLGTASGTDMELFNSSWLILNYRYTSTRDRLLWLDDLRVEGVIYEDRTPPEITAYTVTGRNSLRLSFNEDLSDEILDPSVFSIENSGNEPLNVKRKAPAVIEIVFHESFRNKSDNKLLISNMCDRSGNCAENVPVIFTPVWADPGDVIVSEIMADPVPPVSLPEKEYLEISNRTQFTLGLANWIVAAENQKAVILGAEIQPEEKIILCSSSDTSLFRKYGRVIGLKSFPSLADDGRMIWLSDSTGNLIHGVEYESDWYGNKLKENGGWSLEMIDTDFPFFTAGNWEASNSGRGGTPGAFNSSARRNPDDIFTGIENVFPENNSLITLTLSETIISIPGHPENILIGEREAISVEAADPLLRKFSVHPAETLSAGKLYTLFLTGEIYDFSGNEISRRSFTFGIPEDIQKNDLVFNELLFNPFPEDPDFLEFYNCSGKVIDAASLWLSSINPETGDTSDLKPVSEEHRCIMPRSYYAITTDRVSLISRYPSSAKDNIFEVPAFPSMPDDKGHLLLMNRKMEVIDEVIYNDRMHYPLIANAEGVSLEKIRPENLSYQSMNWHSASESSGWGTPGSENSSYSANPSGGDRVSLSSGRISPDNDGYEDVLVIDINGQRPGNVLTTTIYDEKGGFVKRIAENYLAGDKASLVWDATADDGSLVSPGIYIIFIELFDSKGRKQSWKKVCSVIR